MQKFIAVRKEDAGEYYCRAKNDAGYAECPPQLMEVCKCVTDTSSMSCVLMNFSCFIFALWFELYRWHWCCGDCTGSTGCGCSAPVYNSRDLLCLQARLLLQSKTDRKQVRHLPINEFLNYFTLSSPKPKCALSLLVTRFQLKVMEWTMSGQRMRLVQPQ